MHITICHIFVLHTVESALDSWRLCEWLGVHSVLLSSCRLSLWLFFMESIHLMWPSVSANRFYPKEHKLVFFRTDGGFATSSTAGPEVRLPPFHRHWEMECCLPWWLHFRVKPSWSLRKTFSLCKTDEELI